MSSAVRKGHQKQAVKNPYARPGNSGGNIGNKANEDHYVNDDGVSVYWFRNSNLRLHDNPSLLFACQTSRSLLPIYVIDPEAPFAQTRGLRAGVARAQFNLECLQDLQNKLTGHGSRLIVLQGKPEKIIPNVLSSLGANQLIYEREAANTPICESDRKVLETIRRDAACDNGTKADIKSYDTHTLFEMEHYVARCPNQLAPASYGSFRKIFAKMGSVPKEVDNVTKVPPLPPSCISTLQKIIGSDSNHQDENNFDIPDLKSIGYDDDEIRNVKPIFPGGEDEGLSRLSKMMKRTKWVANFQKPKTLPNALECDTTGLSPYIKHGCVSPRRFYHELSKVYDMYPDKHSLPPVSLHGQLLWREYNYLTSHTTPNFDRMVGNPLARQIPWDHNPTLIDAWKNAQTGYPFIDAIMTELRLTGWIHHLARHAVACFLTRGDLWQNWEEGALIFEELLVDADWSINNFNWQWLSCTAHFYQYFRCYSPVAFGKKTDKNGDYIRKWLPQFRTFPAKYIYEPWTAPKAVQNSAGVVIGVDYPKPIVDHRMVSQANMAKMKLAYDAHKSGQPLVIPDRRRKTRDVNNDDDEGHGSPSSGAPSAKRGKYDIR